MDSMSFFFFLTAGACISLFFQQLRAAIKRHYKVLVAVFNHYAAMSRPGTGFTIGVRHLVVQPHVASYYGTRRLTD